MNCILRGGKPEQNKDEGEKVLFVRFNVSVPVSKLILKPAKRLVFNLGILQAGFCTD